MRITLNEGLSWLKTLKTRQAELIRLRDASAKKTTQVANQYATTAVERREVVISEPTYDAKELDKTIAKLSREIRILESAIKRMNGKTVIEEYEQNDEILGELV